MKDPIERQDAIDAADRADYTGLAVEDVKKVTDEVVKELKQLPSAQPEIVTCKDCRWRKDQSGSTAWLPCRAIVTPSDFYCGRAERRTDERFDRTSSGCRKIKENGYSSIHR